MAVMIQTRIEMEWYTSNNGLYSSCMHTYLIYTPVPYYTGTEIFLGWDGEVGSFMMKKQSLFYDKHLI